MPAQVPTRTCSDLPEFLKAEELADLLRINRKTIYEAARRDEIPGAVRVGRLLRFRRDAVLAWMHASDHR
jgi:excisionase family DNA binding protein